MVGRSSCVIGGELSADGRVPEGVYAEWGWDGKVLHASTDRLGFQPLYYAVSGPSLWLSPSIPALLAQGAPAELDYPALSVFLRIRVFVGDDTPFTHVRAVPPGAKIRWEAGRVTVSGGRPQHERSELRREDALDRYVELFRDAVGRTASRADTIVVPLSGGHDSRHILFELKRAGVPVECVTIRPVPGVSNEDAVIATDVAKAVNAPHTLIGPTGQRFNDERDKNVMTSLSVIRDHFWVMELRRFLEERNAVVYDGIAGDTLSRPKYMNAHRLEMFCSGDLNRYAEEELSTEGYLSVLLQPEAYRRLSRDVARERLVKELGSHLDSPNPVSSYRFWNRTRRAVSVAPFGMLAAVATVRAPFLDDAVFDFLSSLPGEMIVDKRFHTDALALAHPSLAGLRFEDRNASPQPAAWHFTRFGLAALKHEVRRVISRHDRGELLNRSGYITRLAGLLAVRRHADVDAIGHLGLYLSQLDDIARIK